MNPQFRSPDADRIKVSSDRRRQPQQRWWRSVTLTLLVFVMTAGVVGLAAAALRQAERRQAEATLDRRAHTAQAAVTADLRRYADALQDLSAAVAAQSDLTADDYAMITSRMRHERLPAVGSLLLVVPRGSRGAVQYSRLVDDGHIDSESAAAQRAEALEAMRVARGSGQVTASRAFTSTSEVKAGEPRIAFVLVGPVYAGPGARDAGAFRGWLVMSMRAVALLPDSLHVSDDSTSMVLTDETDAANPIEVARWNALPGSSPGALTRHLEITAAQHTWRLTVAATQPLVTGAAAYFDEATFIGGILIAVLLAAMVWLLATSRERALSGVEQATAALRADIARRETAEARLREREEELAGLVAVTAHDLKTPLTNVAAYADLLAEVAADDLDETCLGFLERIGTGTRRMTRLINDLLDFSTAERAPLRPERVDLGALVTEVVAEHTAVVGDARPNVHVGSLPVVRADPAALRRLLDNLITNAIKYVRHGDTAQITIGARREPNGWRIEVADRGIGITPDQRQAIFTAFHRDRAAEGYPGTGLGLAICQRIVDRHGGHIGVEANPGGGSRFWFTLPAAEPTELGDQAEAGSQAQGAALSPVS